MSLLIALWLALQSSPGEAEAFRHTSPDLLSNVEAVVHLGAARVAARKFRVDAADLLAIAWHESRYRFRTRTVESGRRVSCGPMTPEPKQSCVEQDYEPLGGYEAGAAHLRRWLNSTACNGNRRCALAGYAGGYYMLDKCKGQTCAVVDDFDRRSQIIHRALIRASE